MDYDQFRYLERDQTEASLRMERIDQELRWARQGFAEAQSAVDESLKAHKLANEHLVDVAARLELTSERNQTKIDELGRGREALLAQLERCALWAAAARYKQQLATAKILADNECQVRIQADKLTEVIDQLTEEIIFAQEAFDEAMLLMSLAEADLSESRKALLRSQSRLHEATIRHSEAASTSRRCETTTFPQGGLENYLAAE